MKIYKVYSTCFTSNSYLQIIVANNKKEAKEIGEKGFIYSDEKLYKIEEVIKPQVVYKTSGKY